MTEPQQRRPQIIGWEITSYCNLECPHCYSAAARKPRPELSTAECKRVIDSMAQTGAAMIGWTGGEPLLREDLEELTEYAGALGIKANITTNGVLLDEARTARLAEAGIRAVQVSLDGSTAERNRRMRATSDEEFDRIINAIRICIRQNLRVHLATLIGRETLDDANNMIALAKREGVDAIRFCGFAPVGRGKGKGVRRRLEFTDDGRDLFAFIQRAQDDSTLVMSFDVSFGPVPPEYGFHKCIAGVETCYVKGNGDVFPCTALLDPVFRIGNLRDESFEQIWQNPRMAAVARFSSEEITGPCRVCDNFSNCHGGCRGSAWTQCGEVHGSTLQCLYRYAACAAQRTSA